jgi:hypothetical protein
MGVSELPYESLHADGLAELTPIRAFESWRAYSSDHSLPKIVIDDFPHRRAIVFAFGSRADRDADVDLLLRLGDNGGASSAVPAWLNPPPPVVSGAKAEPMPTDSAA